MYFRTHCYCLTLVGNLNKFKFPDVADVGSQPPPSLLGSLALMWFRQLPSPPYLPSSKIPPQ